MSSCFGVGMFFRTFPKKFYCCRVCRAPGGFLCHNNKFFGFVHDPATLRILPRAGSCQSRRYGKCYGVWHHRI